MNVQLQEDAYVMNYITLHGTVQSVEGHGVPAVEMDKKKFAEHDVHRLAGFSAAADLSAHMTLWS